MSDPKYTGKAPPAIPGAVTAKQAHKAIKDKVPRGTQKGPVTFDGWLKNKRGAAPVPTFDDFERLENERDRR